MTPTELETVRAHVHRLWCKMRGPLPECDRDECVSRVVLVIVEQRSRTRSLVDIARTVIRQMRKQLQRDRETAATMAFASTRFDDLPSHIPVPTPTGWGGARANSGGTRPNSGGARKGAGRPRKRGNSSVKRRRAARNSAAR